MLLRIFVDRRLRHWAALTGSLLVAACTPAPRLSDPNARFAIDLAELTTGSRVGPFPVDRLPATRPSALRAHPLPLVGVDTEYPVTLRMDDSTPVSRVSYVTSSWQPDAWGDTKLLGTRIALRPDLDAATLTTAGLVASGAVEGVFRLVQRHGSPKDLGSTFGARHSDPVVVARTPTPRWFLFLHEETLEAVFVADAGFWNTLPGYCSRDALDSHIERLIAHDDDEVVTIHNALARCDAVQRDLSPLFERSARWISQQGAAKFAAFADQARAFDEALAQADDGDSMLAVLSRHLTILRAGTWGDGTLAQPFTDWADRWMKSVRTRVTEECGLNPEPQIIAAAEAALDPAAWVAASDEERQAHLAQLRGLHSFFAAESLCSGLDPFAAAACRLRAVARASAVHAVPTNQLAPAIADAARRLREATSGASEGSWTAAWASAFVEAMGTAGPADWSALTLALEVASLFEAQRNATAENPFSKQINLWAAIAERRHRLVNCPSAVVRGLDPGLWRAAATNFRAVAESTRDRTSRVLAWAIVQAIEAGQQPEAVAHAPALAHRLTALLADNRQPSENEWLTLAAAGRETLGLATYAATVGATASASSFAADAEERAERGELASAALLWLRAATYGQLIGPEPIEPTEVRARLPQYLGFRRLPEPTNPAAARRRWLALARAHALLATAPLLPNVQGTSRQDFERAVDRQFLGTARVRPLFGSGLITLPNHGETQVLARDSAGLWVWQPRGENPAQSETDTEDRFQDVERIATRIRVIRAQLEASASARRQPRAEVEATIAQLEQAVEQARQGNIGDLIGTAEADRTIKELTTRLTALKSVLANHSNLEAFVLDLSERYNEVVAEYNDHLAHAEATFLATATGGLLPATQLFIANALDSYAGEEKDARGFLVGSSAQNISAVSFHTHPETAAIALRDSTSPDAAASVVAAQLEALRRNPVLSSWSDTDHVAILAPVFTSYVSRFGTAEFTNTLLLGALTADAHIYQAIIKTLPESVRTDVRSRLSQPR